MDKLTQAFTAGMIQRGFDRGVDISSLLKSGAMGGKLSGKAKETGITAKDVSKKQLSEGVKVEKEHTSDPQIAKHIAKDHLAEIHDYYTRLGKMEEGAPKRAEVEGTGEIPEETAKKIREYVKNTPNLDDSDFHAFVEGLGSDPHEAEEVVYRLVRSLSKKADSGGFGGVPGVARLSGERRGLTEAEMIELQKGLGQWFPKVFQSAGTPVAQTLASPLKNSLLHGAMGAIPGAAIGGGLGYLIGKKDLHKALVGAGIGAGVTGLLSTVRQYIRRKRENEDVTELLHRLPEEPVLRDLMFQEDRDKMIQAKVQRAVNVAGRRLF